MFDLATISPLPVITPRAEFDKLPDGTINRSSLFDSNGEKPVCPSNTHSEESPEISKQDIEPKVSKTTPKVKFEEENTVISDNEPTSESDAEFTSESESTSSTMHLTTRKSARTISPHPSTALASARNFRLIPRPENFKDSYKHLRELLEEHGWKAGETDFFIVRPVLLLRFL